MKYANKIILGQILHLTCYMTVFGQNYSFKIDGLLSKNYVQIPEASAIRQVSMSSVNYSTGSVDIRIPLFNIECGELNLPIYLSYNSTGIKVNEPCGWVGQNWTLHAEPILSLNPRGHIERNDYCDCQTYQGRTNYYWVRRYLDNNIEAPDDALPDEYNYTLLSGGGMFMRCHSEDNNCKYTTFPVNDNKIVYDGHFIITDPSGTVYEYGKGYDQSISPIRYVTSWHATSVTAANGKDALSFKYENLQRVSINRHEDHITVVDDLQRPNMMGYNGGFTTFFDIPPKLREDYPDVEELFRMPVVYKTFDNYTTSYQVDNDYNLVEDGRVIDGVCYYPDISFDYQHLSEISFLGNTADFITDSDGFLHEIIARNRDNQVIRHFVFDYECYRRRHFLTNVTEVSSDGKCVSQYKLNYIQMDRVAAPGTRAYDFWGFNNTLFDIPDTVSLVPEMKLFTKRNVPAGSYVTEEYDSLTIGGDANYPKVRHADEQCMLYGVLSSIEHPTGAVERFEWEANRACIEDRMTNEISSEFHITNELDCQDSIYVLGGLRIKELSILEGDVIRLKKTFTYGINEDGAGKTPLKNGPNYFLREKTKFYDDNDFRTTRANSTSRHRTLSSSPVVPITYYNGSSVMYEQVSEYTYIGDAPAIKTVYNYTLPELGGWQLLTRWDIWDYNIHNYSNWFTDHLDSIEVYKITEQNLIKASSEIYSYQLVSKTSDIIKGREYRNDTYENFSDEDIPYLQAPSFDYLDFSFSPKANLLLSQEHTEYMHDGTTLRTVKNYAYDNPGSTLVTSQSISQGDSEYTIHSRYPSNVHNGIYPDMVRKNMLDYPIEERVERNGKIISARLCTYLAQDSCFYPSCGYTYTPGSDTCLTRDFDFFDGSTVSSLYRLSHSMAYAQGRIMRVTDHQNISTYYSWDRNRQYPTSMRKVGGSIQFQSVYDYFPGVGMISETGPNGQSHRYQYDSAGRLSEIRDTDGRVTHSFSYKYASGDDQFGQIVPTSVLLTFTSNSMPFHYRYKLNAVISPSSALTTLSWSSSDTNVAQVSDDGTISIISGGICIITATTSNGLRASCRIMANSASKYYQILSE